MAGLSWKKVGHVLRLHIYPLKSGRRITVDKIEVTRKGFRMIADNKTLDLRDRSFMIYGDEDKVGKSGREYGPMVLIKMKSTGMKHVAFEAPGMDEIVFPIPRRLGCQPFTLKLQSWSEERVPAYDCGDIIASWLSKYLLKKGRGLRLGYCDETFQRSFDQYSDKQLWFNSYKNLSDGAFGLLADLGSISILSYKSVSDLNERIKTTKITENSFRANLIVDGQSMKPYDENTWQWIKIGNVLLYHQMEITRCPFIMVDPESGSKVKDNEPYATLIKYRKSKGPYPFPSMAVYVEVKNPGIIHVGEEVLAGER